MLFLGAGAGAGEKNTRSRSRSNTDRLRNTADSLPNNVPVVLRSRSWPFFSEPDLFTKYRTSLLTRFNDQKMVPVLYICSFYSPLARIIKWTFVIHEPPKLREPKPELLYWGAEGSSATLIVRYLISSLSYCGLRPIFNVVSVSEALLPVQINRWVRSIHVG